MKTQMIIVAAPSGAGKSSFVDRICQEDKRLRDTVTYTTRSMRKGESQGHPYHFVTLEDFEQKVKEGFFVEYANVHNKMYGTPLAQIEDTFRDGLCVIMDVDVQGAETFKAKYPQAKSIFIIPPSIEELRRRIIKRDGKIPDDIEVRMTNAQKEMESARNFDVQIVNDHFESSFAKFKEIVENWLA